MLTNKIVALLKVDIGLQGIIVYTKLYLHFSVVLMPAVQCFFIQFVSISPTKIDNIKVIANWTISVTYDDI